MGRALGLLGWTVRTVAGAGPVDRRPPGLAMDARTPRPGRGRPCAGRRRSGHRREPVLAPLEPRRGGRGGGGLRRTPRRCCTTTTCRGSVPTWPHLPPPPDDAAWAHVTINELSRDELAAHGIDGHHDLQRLRPGSAAGRPDATCRPPRRPRWQRRCCCSPRVHWRARTSGGGIALAEALDATYWLLGPAEDGYGPELDRSWSRPARCPVLLGSPPGGCSIADAYAACDAVALPRPGRASATRRWSRQPTAGRWPSARIRWRRNWRLRLPLVRRTPTPPPLARWLGQPDDRLIAHNQRVAAEPLQPGRPAGSACRKVLRARPPVSDRSVT